jgi:hypothetical protein
MLINTGGKGESTMKGRKIVDCLRDEYNTDLRKDVLGNVQEGGHMTKNVRDSTYSPKPWRRSVTDWHDTLHNRCCRNAYWPPLWSSGQSSWLQIQRFRVLFPELPDFLRSSGSWTGSTQPRVQLKSRVAVCLLEFSSTVLECYVLENRLFVHRN